MTWTRRLTIALGILAHAATHGWGAAPEAKLVDRPPLIASVRGPEHTAWAGCAILLEGRSHQDPPPQVSTLCLVDGKPTVSVLGRAAARSHAVAVEAVAEGGLRILVGRPGGIDEIRVDRPGAPARTATLAEDDALEPYSLLDRPDLDGDGRIDLLQAIYDGVALWRRRDDGAMESMQALKVPASANSDGEQITVSGRGVLEPVPTAPVRFTWPETVQGSRLRTFRVPLPPAGGGVCAAWIDAESQVYASRAVFLSGESPRLVALVAPSDRVALFGNLSLLVAPLACDATARGSRPSLLVTTEFDSNIGWADLGVRDVTGDGLPDIAIVGRKGLMNERLLVAVYPARPDGSFAQRPATGERSDLDPLGAIWDTDVDKDGKLDLVVLDRTRVMLARGIAVKGPGDLPFDLRKPVFAPLPDSVTPRALSLLADFDGDGRLEALVAGEERKDDEKKGAMHVRFGGEGAEKDARLVIVRFPAARAD